ncbi:MAG: YaiO family outer membrane beta-barrel protein [bacterium]|nr:YaiO family outer membrane beta-barrel protein [bacterium]
MPQVLPRIAVALALAVSTMAGMAHAGELTLNDSVYSFSSPGNLYGPWSIQTLRYQEQMGKDVPSITLLNRNDADRPKQSDARAAYLDDYHAWSPGFYTYAQVSVASGQILPYRMAYLEADAKLNAKRNFVLGLGLADMQNPDGSATRFASIGPSYYAGPMVYTLRFMPSNTNGINTSATELVTEYSVLGRDQVTFTLVDGSQPSVLVGFPPSLVTFQRLFEADLTVKHWIRPNFGIILGGTLGNHYDRATGASIYHERGITLGIFFGRAVGLPR